MASTVIKQYLKEIPAIILFPQCRPDVYWTDPRMDKMVMQQIETVKNEFSVDEKRKYLLGVSMGGYGVWHFAAEYPKNFAALVSICGGSPLKGWKSFFANCRKDRQNSGVAFSRKRRPSCASQRVTKFGGGDQSK